MMVEIEKTEIDAEGLKDIKVLRLKIKSDTPPTLTHIKQAITKKTRQTSNRWQLIKSWEWNKKLDEF